MLRSLICFLCVLRHFWCAKTRDANGPIFTQYLKFYKYFFATFSAYRRPTNLCTNSIGFPMEFAQSLNLYGSYHQQRLKNICTHHSIASVCAFCTVANSEHVCLRQVYTSLPSLNGFLLAMPHLRA